MKKIAIYSGFIIVLFSITTLVSRSFRVSQIPNGGVNSCQNCHTNPAGGGARNDFGKLIEAKFLVSSNVNWGPLLASLDADNDGVTNGEELQDPFGLWTTGSTAPGNSALVSQPGSSSSNQLSMLGIAFSGMTPHVGQKLFLRVFDKLNMMEVGRTEVPSITSDFTISLNAVLPGHSYFVDFFADHNGNGFYDAPPADHAWRMELNNAAGSDQLDFSHNTNFTDIKWPYLLTVQLSGMTVHIGQLLEMRVVDNSTGLEAGRKRIELIPSDAFNVAIPGIELGKEYKLFIYADANKNGVYDAPPADHSYELTFTNNTGNVELPFTHNTNFVNIDWKYLYTLNFTGMTPHAGQFFEIRVVKNTTDEEVGRYSLTSINGALFSISIPGIEKDTDYRVDFYADLNLSGQYEAPPNDHAWRLTFNSTTGNFVQNFTHNTDFTDIQWPNISGVDDKNISLNPAQYQLAQNYPNPFNPSTKIQFSIPVSGFVTLKVYDVLGSEIATLLQGNISSGVHAVNFNADSFRSGVYFYRIQSGNFIETKKMILMK
ncbi:MAG: T9SS type A sorting domain-containing protein [bacterium]